MSTHPERLGPYTIDREIGRGGMGVVYLGLDTRLDRPVAIKSLPEHLAQDPDRLARFEREARTLATLTHPNVAGIFGVEKHEGAMYLILEYVEGETLAERLDRGALPVDDALDFAVQIAAGVEAAHEAGIIHRDLKPDNIKITPEGVIKVLDFGLAKSTESQTTSSTNIPTVTSPAILNSPTIPGAIMGTAPYMSPEQARGRSVDKRTDIWSFGVILYEMLTSASPFRGETVSDSIGAILHKDVDLALLPPDTPRAARRVLDRCLDRDKNKRLRDIGDAGLELERAGSSHSYDEPAATGARRGVHPALAALLMLLFALAGAGAIVLTRSAPIPPPMIRATILPPDDNILVYLGDLAGPAVISRDGSRIAYVAKVAGEQQRLFIRDLDSNETEPVRGADGAMFPFWSWDGISIAYFSNGDLRAYDTQTGASRTICPAPGGRGGAWLADGSIVFTPGFQSPIHRVSAQGGEATPITSVNAARHTSHRWPRPTPGGDNFIYIAVSHDEGRIDESAIFLATPSGEPDIEITRARFGAEILDGQLLVIRNSTLTATPFKDTTGELNGAPVPIITDIANDLSTWNAPFSASETGVIVFHEQTASALGVTRAGAAASLGENLSTQLIARDGRLSNIIADGVPQNSLSLSPDALTLAISGKPGGPSTGNSFDIWLYQLPTSLYVDPIVSAQTISGERSGETQTRLSEPPRRLTFQSGTEVCPQWSPDGQWLAFGSLVPTGTAETHKLYKVRVSGGSPIPLLESPNGTMNGLWPTDWTADGRYIIYVKGSWVETSDNDIFAFDLETNESIPLVIGEGDQYNAEVSPDGKWMLYTSAESGIHEVYVVPFPPGWEADRELGNPSPALNAKWRVSIAGAGKARWSPTGNELFYIARSNSMIAVPVRTEGVDFIHSAGSAIFQTRYDPSIDFDVTPDGAGFAINGNADETSTSISILTSWQSLLNQ